MNSSPQRNSCRSQLPHSHLGDRCFGSSSGSRILVLLFLLFVISAHAQDSGTAATEFHGQGVAISVVVHGPSGQPISSSAIVKVFRGTIPAGQAETNGGRAEIFANELGDFTVVVQAAGYASAQKDVSINANGRADVDVYLRSSTVNVDGVPGRPLLAPKAKKAMEEAFTALASDNLTKAQKHASQAVYLAPGHPDVLYLQGVIFLKERDWSKAQGVLEKATQIDPFHANAFAGLGMALCDEGKYEAAVAPLEKALQLNPARSSWDARWALAKAYYGQARYDRALEMSQTALSFSDGKAPEIELLVAQSLTAMGRYEDAAQALREFLGKHADHHDAALAQRWLRDLVANGKIQNR